MNIQLPVQMDQQAFLAWVQGREEGYELDRGRVIMMTGGSRAHWQITSNILNALRARLDPERFAVLPEFGIDLGPQTIRFPDVVVDLAGESPGDLKANEIGQETRNLKVLRGFVTQIDPLGWLRTR